MARMRKRVAAGSALVAAVITVGGPGVAAAPADPGHGGSHRDRGDGGHGGGSQRGGSRNDSSNGDDRGRNGRDDRDRRGRGGYGRGGDDGRRGGDDRRGHDGRRGDGRNGSSGRDDSGSDYWDDNGGDDGSASTPTTASRVATTSRVAAVQSAQPESESVGVQSVDTPSAPTTSGIGAEATAPVFASGGGGGAPVAPFERPTVVFGNGRTPDLLATGGLGRSAVPSAPSAPVQPVLPGPASAAPETTIVLPSTPPNAIPGVGAESQLPRVVSEIWRPVQPGGNSGALFGLAGLILIPLAGIWLGYQQAAAARAAAKLVER